LGCVFISEEKIIQLLVSNHGESKNRGKADESQKQSTLAVIRVSCCWAAVAVAAIMDVRLMFNNIIITDHGTWLRGVETCLYGGTNSPGWENFFHSKDAILLQPPYTTSHN
jgi:hypothetical protein